MRILLILGLNMNPEAMSEIKNHFIKKGHDVHIHHHKYQSRPNTWEKDFYHILDEYRPDQIIAHSLGSTLALLALIDKKIQCNCLLICPPLILNKSSQIFLELITKLPFEIKVPSFNLKNYRVNSFTTNFDYLALLKIIKKLKQQFDLLKEMKNIKLVFVKNDELIDSKKSLKVFGGSLITKNGIGPNHLFIDSATCGKEHFNKLLKLL